MKKSGVTILEIIIVLLIMVGAFLLVLPKGLETKNQAKIVSKWAQKYSDLQYMFLAVKAQFDTDNNLSRDSFENMVQAHIRILKPLTTTYQPYMNNGKLPENEDLQPSEYYISSSNEIIGIKWLDKHCNNGDKVCAIITFDFNGLESPNEFGRDVFGVELSQNSIKAFGENEADIQKLREDCEKTGIYCSYYYLIGGRYD